MLRRTVSIGSIAGVPIALHWSWIVVLLLVTAALSQLYAGVAGAAGAWPMAIAAALLLSLSVLLHELGHALVARRFAMAVHGITLFALGGVTEILDTEPQPVRDLLVALAGPAVSLLLAVVGGLAWWWAAAAPALGLLALHMALTNGAMAIFNLLPGFPLDGGRVLWATLAFLLDDALHAARVAAWTGRIVGWALLGCGVLYSVAATDLLNGLWVALVGYVLMRNATAGYRRFVVQRLLSGVSVADLMQRVYRAVAPELPLDQFVGRYVLGQVEQGFPVLSRPETDAPQPLLGMMTLRDLRRFQFHEWSFTHVGEAMTPAHRLRALDPRMSGGEAFRTLLESGEDQLPVIDGATLLGVLRRRDLLGYIERGAARR
ncbi:MAG: site-2 protease family protein [Kouleothrix sp.]|nr:site-2 protease family protein [Kouleothrix sp.]